MATPNMNLALPSVGVTSGPQWASLINAALETVDFHDHSAGKGVPITPAGLSINADLDFASNNATGLRSLRMVDQGATLSNAEDLRILYSKNGELAYRDGSGNEVIMTASGSVAGATGSITGLSSPASAAFSAVTGAFIFSKDTNKPAKVNISDISLYEYDNASANAITIKSPTLSGSAYTITLPAAVPAAKYPVSMQTNGALDVSGMISIADGTAATPSLNFANDTNTGIYRLGPDRAGLAAGGANIITYGPTGVTYYTEAKFVDGTVSAPGVAFADDPDNGMYRPTTNQVAFTAGGTQRLLLSNAGATVTGGIQANNLNLNGGGAFRATLYTGTVAAGATITLTPSGTPYGAIGYETSGQPFASYTDSLYTNTIQFTTGNAGEIRFVNRFTTTRSYRVIIFHS